MRPESRRRRDFKIRKSQLLPPDIFVVPALLRLWVTLFSLSPTMLSSSSYFSKTQCSFLIFVEICSLSGSTLTRLCKIRTTGFPSLSLSLCPFASQLFGLLFLFVSTALCSLRNWIFNLFVSLIPKLENGLHVWFVCKTSHFWPSL